MTGAKMLFRKKPKPPLEMAFQFLANAILIVYGYQHNKRYMPSEHDLKMIDLLEREMQLDCATVGYVERGQFHPRRVILGG